MLIIAGDINSSIRNIAFGSANFVCFLLPNSELLCHCLFVRIDYQLGLGWQTLLLFLLRTYLRMLLLIIRRSVASLSGHDVNLMHPLEVLVLSQYGLHLPTYISIYGYTSCNTSSATTGRQARSSRRASVC